MTDNGNEDDEQSSFKKYFEEREKYKRYADGWFPGRSSKSQEETKFLSEIMAVEQFQIEEKEYSGDLFKPDSDPPDVILKSNAGRNIGIEVTELVHRPTIEANVDYYRGQRKLLDHKYTNYHSELGRELFQTQMDEIITRKDEKIADKFTGGNFDELILLIVTAEFVLRETLVRNLLEAKIRKTKHFNKVYLMLDYHPRLDGKGNYPVFAVT